MTKFVKVTEIDMMSCLQGYVNTTYADLVAIFGEPTVGPSINSIDDKVTCEWRLTFGRGKSKILATIYDWKTYSGTPMDEYEWHIGGSDPKAVELVTKCINEYQWMVCEQLSAE